MNRKWIMIISIVFFCCLHLFRHNWYSKLGRIFKIKYILFKNSLFLPVLLAEKNYFQTIFDTVIEMQKIKKKYFSFSLSKNRRLTKLKKKYFNFENCRKFRPQRGLLFHIFHQFPIIVRKRTRVFQKFTEIQNQLLRNSLS